MIRGNCDSVAYVRYEAGENISVIILRVMYCRSCLSRGLVLRDCLHEHHSGHQ